MISSYTRRCLANAERQDDGPDASDTTWTDEDESAFRAEMDAADAVRVMEGETQADEPTHDAAGYPLLTAEQMSQIPF